MHLSDPNFVYAGMIHQKSVLHDKSRILFIEDFFTSEKHI